MTPGKVDPIRVLITDDQPIVPEGEGPFVRIKTRSRNRSG